MKRRDTRECRLVRCRLVRNNAARDHHPFPEIDFLAGCIERYDLPVRQGQRVADFAACSEGLLSFRPGGRAADALFAVPEQGAAVVILARCWLGR